ncbi:uncharacterized protein [Parasteatoda tepidariorum]|uniref:uncharacterized protein isoform X2 n=1 Tax=Parasteatoda tepidariorum TaxID=114398 RepID=UPI001C720109|nr:uncharacterized protein LOC122272889 isoform X2 [Parasteatoda tepidariorum]
MMEEEDKFPEAALGRSICLNLPEQVPKLVTFLNPLSVDIHHIVAVAFFVEFLSQCYKGCKSLTKPLMNSLLEGWWIPLPSYACCASLVLEIFQCLIRNREILNHHLVSHDDRNG